MAKRRKRQRKYTKRYKQAHRLAPMPSWFNDNPWGRCRWCNKTIYKEDGITENKRRRWHPDCLHDYLIITDHRYAKRQVKKRDKGICASCGAFCRYRWEWECDHVVPLADRPDDDLKWWRLSALTTRCIGCHKKKTIQENANRRKRKADSKRQKVDKRKHSKRDT